MMHSLVLVAVGGAVGASLRHLLGVAIYRVTNGPHDFPVAIITANVLGSFIMGAFVVFAANRGLAHLSPLVMTGLLGGFTTFSAFSLETVTLIERGSFGLAALYVALSVALSILGLLAGLWMMRTILL